jgi:exosortase
MSSPDASYLVWIPFFTAFLVYLERRSIFRRLSSDRRACAVLVLSGIGLDLGVVLTRKSLTPDLQLTGYIAALLLVYVAGFALFFGRTALTAAYFPLLFLLLMIPLPDFLLYRVIHLLQTGSAIITEALFNFLGVPALREGFVFHLAQVNIEIAKECSGIRSSIALLVLALPAVHFGMRRLWKKAIFLVSALLMMSIKNGIRIVTLTLLAIYVDPSFLYGRLHHEGGIVFFLLGLLLLLPLYLLLQDSEAAVRKNRTSSVNESQTESVDLRRE